MLILGGLVIGNAAAQTSQPTPPVDPTCCYMQTPRCEGTCPIVDFEPREACKRDCEARLRACLSQGAFAPKVGQPVMCVRGR